MHRSGYIHNDVKEQNRVVGNNNETAYLIDFGFATKYVNSNGSHLEQRYRGVFMGNPLFASTNQCEMNTTSRRDDIQSLVYLLIYML